MIQNYKKFFLLKLLHALTELLNQCRSGITDVYKKYNVDLINLLKQVKCDIESCNTIGTNLEHLGGPHTPDCIHEISEVINNLYQILDEAGNLYVDIRQEISAIRILIEDIEHLILKSEDANYV